MAWTILLTTAMLLGFPLGVAVDPAGTPEASSPPEALPAAAPLVPLEVRTYEIPANATPIRVEGATMYYDAATLVLSNASDRNLTVRWEALPAGASPGAAPAKRDDGGGRAPPTPAAVRPMEGIERPMGVLRAIHDVLRALLEILRALGLAGILLYHRISGTRALDHPMRARLLDAVRREPGAHAAALAERLDAHAKTVLYHLRVLARTGSVRLEREGRVLRAWPSGAPGAAPPDASRTRARALDLVRAGVATDREGLAAILGVTPQAMSYHLKLLRRQGRVRVRWLGRSLEYEAVENEPGPISLAGSASEGNGS